MIQGDIISPVLFILALDELLQQYDKVEGEGYRCGRILRLRVLGYYADDVTLIGRNVEEMTTRLAAIANTSRDNADVKVNMAKLSHNSYTGEARWQLHERKPKPPRGSTSSHVTSTHENSRQRETCRYTGVYVVASTTTTQETRFPP